MSMYLGSAYIVLQWIGVFPPNDSSVWSRWAFNVYRVFVFGLTATVTVLMTVQMFVATDLTTLARTIDIWTMFLSGLYKWFCMAAFSAQFVELSTGLKCIQAQGTIAYGKSADQFTANHLKLKDKITIWYLFFGIMAVFIFVISPLITYPQGNRSIFEYYNDPKSYPLSCWLPFLINEKWKFLIVFTSQFVALTFVAQMYLGIDSFLFGAIYAVGGQIKLLNLSMNNIKHILAENKNHNGVENLVEFSENELYTKEKQVQFQLIIKECVKHHILILEYIKKVHQLFSSLIIVDYVHGLTSLSFALFQITINNGIVETIGVVGFIIMSLSHQYFNNFFGEYIIQKQLSVSLTAYDIPWWRNDKVVRQISALMILRSNKPNVISGFYMYMLSYPSFIAFVKALYTYYMVLRRVNLEE